MTQVGLLHVQEVLLYCVSWDPPLYTSNATSNATPSRRSCSTAAALRW